MKKSFTKEEVRSIFNKVLRKQDIPTEIRAALTLTDENGNLIVPEELKTDLLEAKIQNKAMRQYVHVIPVKSRKGRFTTEDESNFGEMYQFNAANGVRLTEKDLKLKGVEWELKSYGSFTAISESLFDDAAVDLYELFKISHGEKSTKTENKLIFNAITQNLTPRTLNGWSELSSSLVKDFNPAIESEIVIVTNQDGWEYLDKQKDAGGEPILDVEPGPKRYFRGYPVEVFANDELPSITDSSTNTVKVPFIYGSFKRSVKLFHGDRIEVYFAQFPFGIHIQKHAIRGIEEYDVQIIPNTTYLIYGQIELT